MLERAIGYASPNYLERIGTRLREDKERTYTVAGIGVGSTVLDLGCGSGTDTIPLARLVGPDGRVVGVDHDPVMVAAADQKALEAGVADRVTHHQADATALPFPDATFDACRSERVFQHLTDPVGALAELVRVTRPGGRVVVLDTDWGTFSVDTPEVDIERRLTRYKAEHQHRNGYSGRRLYGMFLAAGLVDVTAEPRTVSDPSYELLRLAFALDDLEREATAAGVVSEEEVARWRASLEAASAAGGTYASVTLVLVAGTVPEA